MSTSRSYDAIIIGAGVIGAAVAFELCKRGYATLNVDKLPASGYGPTSASCAIVRFTYSTWDGVAMAYEGSFYWNHWREYLEAEDERGLARYHAPGTLVLRDRAGRDEKVLRLFDDVGVPYEIWDRDEIRRRLPYIDLHTFWPPTRPDDPSFWQKPTDLMSSAIYTPGSGYVNDPQLATHNLQRAAEAKGATFQFRTAVVDIRRARGRIQGVTLDGGERVDAPIVVNVAGPHSGMVNRMAGVEASMRVRTRPLRHEVHIVPAPPGVNFESDGLHISDEDSGIYFRPEAGNMILLGSEDPECDRRDWILDPDHFDPAVTRDQWEAQVFRLARRIPSLGIPNQPRGLVSLYDVSDDWIPIYDASELSGFYMAIGTSGNQFKNAGVVGHLMAELIDACENGHVHDTDPVRVKAAYTKLELDAGFYSRLRELNPDSSFSVNG